MLSLVTVPQTISSSYGSDEYTVPPDHAIFVCNLFARLTSRGASLLFASGDGGVGTGNCQFRDMYGNPYVRFRPTFPSTCTCIVFSLTEK
jgi:tripeptidyl-peptidase-1